MLSPRRLRAHASNCPNRNVCGQESRSGPPFLTVPDEEWQSDPSAIVQAYRDAIPSSKRFAWDATSGQLDLLQR
jgi:hypothetical protein